MARRRIGPLLARPSSRAIAVAAIALGLGAPGCGRDNRPATWEYISPIIFQPSCASGSCHSPASAVAGLDLSTPDRGYTSLSGLWVWIVDPKGTPEQGCKVMEGTVVCQRNQRALIVPYVPSQSRLVNVLRARDAPRMPPDRPLAEGDIDLVERWILGGAARTVGGPPAGAPTTVDASADAPVVDGALDSAAGAGGVGGASGAGGAGGGSSHGGASGAAGSS
jgi:hypothetical protein